MKLIPKELNKLGHEQIETNVSQRGTRSRSSAGFCGFIAIRLELKPCAAMYICKAFAERRRHIARTLQSSMVEISRQLFQVKVHRIQHFAQLFQTSWQSPL